MVEETTAPNSNIEAIVEAEDQNDTDQEDEDIDGCEFDLHDGDEDMTLDEDLPASEGGVA